MKLKFIQMILLIGEQIRSIGEHEIIVNPYTDIQETIKITVHKN